MNMKRPNPIHNTNYSLSTKICLFLLPFVVGVFVYALGDLFLESRRMVRQEAIERAHCELDNTVARVAGYLNEAETISRNIKWQVLDNLCADSLLPFTQRAVALNPDINGCSITMEPDMFPEQGHYCSVYSVRFPDNIESERDTKYNFYNNVWYRTVHQTGKPAWVDPYDDYNEGCLSSPEMITSYCDPIYTNDGNFIGVITTDISLQWLSKVISQEKPYENSYCIMLGQDGHFFVHPDSTRLVKKTIFDDTDPLTQSDVIALGHEMMAQKNGYMQVNLNGEVCYVFYQPMPHTRWSIALVCPESDIFSGYNRLAFILFPLLTVGLVLMFVLCRKIVAFFIKPLGHLERETRWIADGNFNFSLPHSNRSDVVGRLQNSFLVMQESLSQHIHHLEDMNAEAEMHNTELARANQLAEEAAKHQTAFLQDVLHQIRTPLNVMMGFVQVLRDDYTIIPKEEMVEIVHTLQHNASTITRIVDMLMASSAIDGRKTIELDDDVTCIGVVTEAEKIFNERLPHMSDLQVETLVDDNLTVLTHKDYLMKILNELLYNAKKFTTNGWVKLKVQDNGDAVLFSVEDKGPGIAESYRQQIFTQFSKFNTFSEGLGLGLSISKQFARLLGGDLWLDTDYTLGARFVLEIPLKR